MGDGRWEMGEGRGERGEGRGERGEGGTKAGRRDIGKPTLHTSTREKGEVTNMQRSSTRGKEREREDGGEKSERMYLRGHSSLDGRQIQTCSQLGL